MPDQASPTHPSVPHPGGLHTLAGHEVTRVGLGVMQLPRRLTDVTAARKVLRRAYELGVTHFDTAYFYGNGAANDYLAQELVREPGLLIVTKVGLRPPKRGPMPMVPAQRPEQLRQAVLDDLRTLRTDHLPVVNLRRVGPMARGISLDDQLAAMVAMRTEGLIGAIGLSAVSLDELRRALPAGIVCVQNPYSLTARKDEPSWSSAGPRASPGSRSSRSAAPSPARRRSPTTRSSRRSPGPGASRRPRSASPGCCTTRPTRCSSRARPLSTTWSRTSPPARSTWTTRRWRASTG